MELTSNKTIAKNTLMLYGRSLLLMFIGLYTSRVILRNLGVTDYGIYNAVGGIVGMFGFISGSLGNATSRFITIAIGREDQEYTNKTFGNIKLIYYGLCVAILILGETIGLWFLYNKMTIPQDRMDAAFWVYQYSILSTILGFICVPYNSAIIAHERMSAFAYISLLDATLKLLICYLLSISPYDRLVTYASLIFCVEIMDRIIYAVYCNRHFEEVKAKACLYREQFKEIASMSGWVLLSNLCWIQNTQGITILQNSFFGPVVNAASGIAMQVQGVIKQFVTNFQTAINPQITKSYARKDYRRMGELLRLSSKYSFFLLFSMSIPVFIEAPIILRLWLVKVPNYTVVFLRIILIYTLIGTLSNPLWTSVLATGNLKKYQLYDSTIQILTLPIAYLSYKIWQAPAYFVYLLLLLFCIIGQFTRVWLVLPMIKQSYYKYIVNVIFPIIAVSCISPILPALIELYFIGSQIVKLILVIVVSVLSSCLIIWLIGFNREERSTVKTYCKTLLQKLKV